MRDPTPESLRIKPSSTSERLRSPAAHVLLLAAAALLWLAAGTLPSANAEPPYGVEGLPLLDDFERSESPLSAGGRWQPLPLATSKNPSKKYLAGDVDPDGWHSHDAMGTYPFFTNGAFWAERSFDDDGYGIAAVAKITFPNDGTDDGGAALWLDLQPRSEFHAPDAVSGYRLSVRAYDDPDGITRPYLFLSKFVYGYEYPIGFQSSLGVLRGNRFGISDEGDRITVWHGVEGDMKPRVTIADDTFSGGSVAIQGWGRKARVTDLRVGEPQPAPEAVFAIPLRDPLDRTERPLSLAGKWTPLAWDTVPNPAFGSGQVLPSGWLTFNGSKQPGQVNGAFWNADSFDDSGQGSGTAVTLPYPEGGDWELALWLDAPDPGTEKSGYELSRTATELVLSRWSEGVRTVLATKADPLPHKGLSGQPETLALSDVGGTVVGWSKEPGAQTWTELLSAADSSFESGYAGFQARGPVRRLNDFRAGAIVDPE